MTIFHIAFDAFVIIENNYYKGNVTVIYYFQVKIPEQTIVINIYDYLTKLYLSQSNYDDS